ncbi:hypothetical protein LCL87_00890 [Rhodococcus hoagii]|nr:hypothetical protein [Prescottella equi]
MRGLDVAIGTLAMTGGHPEPLRQPRIRIEPGDATDVGWATGYAYG